MKRLDMEIKIWSLNAEVKTLKSELEDLRKTSIKIGKNRKVGNIRIGKCEVSK